MKRKARLSIRSSKCIPWSQLRERNVFYNESKSHHKKKIQLIKKGSEEDIVLEKRTVSSSESESFDNGSRRQETHKAKSIFSKTPPIKHDSQIIGESFEMIENDNNDEIINCKVGNSGEEIENESRGERHSEKNDFKNQK